MSSEAEKWPESFVKLISNLKPSSIEGSQINILFFGPPGHGKSACANSTLGREIFKVSCDGDGDSTTVKSGLTCFENHSVKIVDCIATPRKNPNKRHKVLEECGRILLQIGKKCRTGFHAVFLVLKFGYRFYEEEEFAMAMLRQMFGPSFVEDHCFCLISHGDLFQREMERRGEGTNFHNWCRQQTGVLRKMFLACNYKCLLFDNSTMDVKKQKDQVQQLMKCVKGQWPQNVSIVSVSPEFPFKADIQMIVESAPSDDAFRDQLRFAIAYTKNLDPDDRSINFNVKIFGEKGHIRFFLNQCKSQPEFAKELMKAEYLKASKGIDHTLEVVNNESSTRRCQGEPPSEPESVFMAENYEELQYLPEDIIRDRVCELAPKHDIIANVLFILDSSGSIIPPDYEKEKNFAIKVTNAFNIGPGALHFSAMIFSDGPQMIFDFGLTTHAEIAKEIRKATHLRQTRDTAAALKLARRFAFTSRNGVESGKKIALVITDSYSNDTIETAREAKKLSLSGVLVLAIGVGSKVNEDELRDIATRPEDVFTVDNFDVLQRIQMTLLTHA